MPAERLATAKNQKNDEFYTRYEDIEKELVFYEDQLKGKKIYCNCDDIGSEFVNYFLDNYKTLELAGLVVTGYNRSGENTTIIRYYTDADTRELFQINGFNGDFRHEESIKILEWCDVVITNPPFSLFREYIAQLIKYNKKFLVIGNMNAISYKEIFPLLKQNKIWLGIPFEKGNAYFSVPENFTGEGYAAGVFNNETRLIKMRNCCWFTNLDNYKRHEPIELMKTYNEEDYPHYDNYDAIEVSKVDNIPRDYAGIMGVPITFLGKYCPEQFEIIDINPHFYSIVEQGLPKPKQLKITGQKDPYARILIRNKHPQEV